MGDFSFDNFCCTVSSVPYTTREAEMPERNLDIEYVEMLHFPRHAFWCFMNAMKAGYASKPTKGTIVELPGSKTIEYTHEKFRLLDSYIVTPQSGYSGGTIHEWWAAIPVWMMQFMGYYDEDAIPCLKAALNANYERGVFYGGRGPGFFLHDGYTYINTVEENDFHGHVRGKETIYNPAGNPVGWHRYQAMWMVRK